MIKGFDNEELARNNPGVDLEKLNAAQAATDELKTAGLFSRPEYRLHSPIGRVASQTNSIDSQQDIRRSK